MREALRQVKPTEFEDLIALVALYRPGPMGYIPVYARRKNGQETVSLHRPASRGDHRRHLRHLHLPGAVHADRQAARRLHARRGGDAPQGDRQEDPRADGVPEGQVPRGLRGHRHRAGSRPAALEGHGAVAGLLLQQGARRLLRADRLPHRLAAREPPARVHGGADLLGDEHEGPRAVLRQRLPRARDRGAAAGREHVPGRLRRRRGQDPLRPERGQERGRGGLPGDRLRAGDGRPVRVDLGLHRAGRPADREQARARVARQVRRARLDRRLAQGDGGGARPGALLGRQRARGPQLRPGLDLRSRRRGRPSGRATTRPIPSDEYEKGELLRLEKETLGLWISEHPLAEIGARAQAQVRPAARQTSSAAATARSSRSAGSSPRSSS